MSISRKGKKIHSSTFRYEDRRLFLARARLYKDRIILTGWGLTGRHKRVIMLDEVEDINWWFGRSDINFALYLHNGEDILMHIRGAGNWKFTIDELRGKNAEVNQGKLPEDPSQRRSMKSDTSFVI